MISKTSGRILEELPTEVAQGPGAVCGGRNKFQCFSTIISSCPFQRSGAGCVLEDTELVGGDIPAILGGGVSLFWSILKTFMFGHSCFSSSGGISLDRDTADECFRRWSFGRWHIYMIFIISVTITVTITIECHGQ